METIVTLSVSGQKQLTNGVASISYVLNQINNTMDNIRISHSRGGAINKFNNNRFSYDGSADTTEDVNSFATDLPEMLTEIALIETDPVAYVDILKGYVVTE